jgi:outer membrane protein TolC
MKKTLTILFLLAIMTGAALSEETVTLKDAYMRAIQGNEQVKIADESLYQARLWPKRAWTMLTPKLSLGAGWSLQKEIKTSYQMPAGLPSTGGGDYSLIVQEPKQTQYQAMIQWTLYQGTILPYWRQARAMAEGAECSNVRAKQEVLFQVATAYYGLLKAQKYMVIATQGMSQAEEHLKLAEARQKSGELTRTAVLRAEMEKAKARKRMVDAENGLAVARESLGMLIGGSPQAAADTGEANAPALDEKVNLATAAKNREDLKKARSDEYIAEQDKGTAYGKFHPALGVDGSYSLTEPAGSFGSNQNWRVTLNLKVPLFQGGTEYLDVMEKNSVIAQARFRREALEKQMALEVKKALLDIDSARKNLGSLLLERDLAEETAKLVETQFKVGVATSIELADSHLGLVTAEQGLADGIFNFNLAVLSLEKANGTFARDLVPGCQ